MHSTRMFKRPTNAINPHPNTAIITAQQVIKSWGADEETINNTQTPQSSLRRAGDQVMGGRREDHQAARRPRPRGGRGDSDRAHRRQHEVRHQAYDPPTPPPVGLIKSNQIKFGWPFKNLKPWGRESGRQKVVLKKHAVSFNSVLNRRQDYTLETYCTRVRLNALSDPQSLL